MNDKDTQLLSEAYVSIITERSMFSCDNCDGERSNLVINHNGEVGTIRGAGTCLSCGRCGGYPASGIPDFYEGDDLEKLREFQKTRS
jgi:hypothetical protein